MVILFILTLSILQFITWFSINSAALQLYEYHDISHEMKNIESIMTISHKENNHEKINKLEEIEILKAAASQNILNDVINGRNDPLYKILISVDY